MSSVKKNSNEETETFLVGNDRKRRFLEEPLLLNQ